jgi:hypothetical protein
MKLPPPATAFIAPPRAAAKNRSRAVAKFKPAKFKYLEMYHGIASAHNCADLEFEGREPGRRGYAIP